jgi:hypothetical protein
MILSTWDIFEPDLPPQTMQQRLYNVIELAGPVVYLMNSVVDVYWAEDLRDLKKRTRRRRERGSQSSSSRPKVGRSVSSKTTATTKVRKFAAHRRGLFAAYSFGCAALFGVIDMLIWLFGNYEATMIAGSDRAWWDVLSVHFYFLSAIFAVCGQRSRPPVCLWLDWMNDQDNLEDLGDLLFLVGSLFDCILCDFHFDDQFGSIFGFLSSLLWLADACLYLRSDFCMQKYIQELTGPMNTTLKNEHELPAYIFWSGNNQNPLTATFA